ncbi:MAG TPA: NAD(P)-binding domain-containing protein [Candidatus Dormibacteraeota bacterium]
MSLPYVCVIGAGSSGIAAAKVLHQRGIPFDCFEKGDRVGGNWVFGNSNGMSSAYRTLHINSSRERMEYSDFPMPKRYPDFPHHTHIAEYFDDYVEHFCFRDHITFNTGVERAEREADGTWTVTLDTGESRRYDALMVANGHHWDPRWPEPPFPGDFDGEVMHSHYYIDNEPLKNKNVLVLGMGNSAMDIAVESSFVADRTFLAARRGAWIIPKYMLGRPLDQQMTDPRIPYAIKQKIFKRMMLTTIGPPERYGLPKPDHELGQAHPTVSSDILMRIAHGEITPKPNIAELMGDRVKFADGSLEPIDVIVYCTGYKVTFPFFDPDFISAPDNDLPLFRRVFKPGVDNVFFIGLLQPLGAIMPLAETQSEWVAEYLLGDYAMPGDEDVRADIEREREAMFRRYVKSERHTMQVDYDEYRYQLGKERKRGHKRAAARNFARPVPARARAAALPAPV